MKEKNIIFVSGIHGVGKTTFCKEISQKYGVEYYSASELISIASRKKFTNKLTNNINNNQKFLMNSIKKILDKDKYYFLDGHFCLLDKNLCIKEIPIDTYQNIGIKSIIVLTDNIHNIYFKLKKRDNIKYNLDLIDSFQKEEIKYANKVALILNVPIIYVNIEDYDIHNFNNIKELLC
ncbi:ATP-binding protein [Clostridium novyi]